MAEATGLFCEQNAFRYRARPDLVLRVSADGSPDDAARSLHAARAAGVHPRLSVASADLLPGEPVTLRYRIVVAPTEAGEQVIDAAGAYAEGGLAFDDSGNLWAITDRRDSLGFPLNSQVMQLSLVDGSASNVSEVGESGFESLAITVPRGCAEQTIATTLPPAVARAASGIAPTVPRPSPRRRHSPC